MDAAPTNPNFREVPGYRDVLRREAAIRDAAFLPDFTEIAGIPVHRMTAWHLNALTAVRNGFVCPCIFDDERERAEHAMQLVWCVSRAYRVPGENDSWWARFKQAIAKSVLAHRLCRRDAERFYQSVADYLDEAFYDAPKSTPGEDQSKRTSPHTSWLAIIMDDLAGAGYTITQDEILRMPLSRLWQFHRRAQRRIYKAPLANASDRWFLDHKDDPQPQEAAR